MIDEDKPLSTNEVPIAMKIEIIPIIPNSVGPKILAITRVPIKEIPLNKKESAKLQINPEIVCFLDNF